MKFAVFGTGGVGGYFGGKLAQAGNDVTFIARGRHLSQIIEAGLRVDSIGGDFVVKPAKATDSSESIGEVDCVLLATKAWQLTEAIEQMNPLVGGRTMLLPLLNGIEHVDMLVDAFGNRVLGGLCRISSFVAGPGYITHVGVKRPSIAFGELKDEKSDRVKELYRIFSSISEIDVDVPDDMQVAMWEKFIFICATSGVGAVTRQSMDVFRSVPETRILLKSAIDEVVQIARRKKVALPDEIVKRVLSRIETLPAGMVASMQKDIMEGKPSELDAQTGAVIRMGRAFEVPTPTHEFIYASLLPLELKARGE